MRKPFTLEYWRDEGWYVGRLKEISGVVSQGETLAELEENIRDAYQLMTDAQPAPTSPGGNRNHSRHRALVT